jgi:hypothetical protein
VIFFVAVLRLCFVGTFIVRTQNPVAIRVEIDATCRSFSLFFRTLITREHYPVLVLIQVGTSRIPQYFNGARLEGIYPLSIPINGMALYITCSSYADKMCFGLTGCRRTVPRLQRMLGQLDDELTALERAAGVR